MMNPLHTDSISLSEPVTDSTAVLQRIAELIACHPLAGTLTAEQAYRALREREAIGSTALGHGIAIPHAALEGVDDFIVGLLTTASPVSFDSPDGKPVDIFFFIVGPTTRRDQHIRLLSAISTYLSEDANARQLRAATDPQRVRDELASRLADEASYESTEKVLFQLFVQNMDVFEDLLNLLSSVVPGSISVLETRNAGAYLFRMPLFAAFWSEKSEQEGRIILAVAEQAQTNSIIRQIHEIAGEPGEGSGVLVTAVNLTYAAGSLSF